MLQPELEPCVQRVLKLDKDDARYVSMLKESFVTNGGILNREYHFKGVALALNFLSSQNHDYY